MSEWVLVGTAQSSGIRRWSAGVCLFCVDGLQLLRTDHPGGALGRLVSDMTLRRV